MAYIFLAIAILAEVTVTTALKASESFTRPLWATVTILGYGTAFCCLSLALRSVATGIAYAIWSGAGIVLISAAAWFVHGQKLDTPALVGMGLIIAGVVIMNVFSTSAAH